MASKKIKKRSSRKRKLVESTDNDEEMQTPPWVLKKGESLPEMTAKRSMTYYLPTRSIEDDEKELKLPNLEKGECPCMYGQKCTSVIDISGGPMVPIKAMHMSKACILCHRKGMRSKYVRHTILEETLPANRLVQKWESVVGEGGYKAESCVGRHEKHYNGFLSHVAIGTATDYTWICEPDTGEWKIDQSEMYFHMPSPTTQP